MKKIAKLLVLLLTVALIVGVIAVVASAEDDAVDYGTDVTDALTNAADGATVTLSGNSYLPAEFAVTKNITIDLAGNTLTLQAANAFSIEGAYSLTIKGQGTIDLWGSFVNSAATGVGENLKVTVAGTDKGIDINHTGTASATHHRIVTTKEGLYTFNNVEIVSTAAVLASNCVGKSTIDAFFETTYDSNTVGAGFVFNASSFICETSMPSGAGHGGQAVVSVAGNGYCNINYSYIKNAGAFAQVGYAKKLDSEGNENTEGNIFTVKNSTVYVGNNYANARIYGIYGHDITGGEDTYVVGTMTFKDSRFIANVYRGAIFGGYNRVKNLSKLVFDGSIYQMASQTANSDGNKGTSMLARCCDVYFVNNSVISAQTNSLTGKQANASTLVTDTSLTQNYVYAEEGTRGNKATVVCGACVPGSTTKIAAAKVYFDPVGNPDYPWVYTTETGAANYLPEGASKMEYDSFEFFGGYTSRTEGYGIRVDNTGSANTSFDTFVQLDCKAGAMLDVTYGNNTSFKYWMSPPASDPNATERTGLGSSSAKTDAYFIFGDKHVYTEASHVIANNAVSVFQFDFATDSELGFVNLNVQAQARNSTNGAAAGDTFMSINSDGSFTNKTMANFNENVKLSTVEWNRITYVVEYNKGATDKASIYVNGELLGTISNAYGSSAAYIMGLRFNIAGDTHKVGTSFLVDNITTITYADYKMEGETPVTDHAAYLPANYATPTKAPLNNNITVAGMPYADINDAIAAANTINAAYEALGMDVAVNVELKGDVESEQCVATDAIVYANGYTLKNLSADTLPANIMYNADETINYYDFREEYKDLTVTFFWYVAPIDNGIIDYENPEFVETQVPVGTVPVAPAEAPEFYFADGYKYAIVGWDDTVKGTSLAFTPITIADAMGDYAAAGEEWGCAAACIVTPVFAEEGELVKATVTNVEGEVEVYATTDAEVSDAFAGLTLGDTFVLYDDVKLTIAGKRFVAAEANANNFVNIDLNGHTVYSAGKNTYVFLVGSYTTVNVYSSVPGGFFCHHGADTSGAMINQRGFGISEDGGESALATQAYLNFGKFEKTDSTVVPGENLKVSAGYVIDGMGGDDTCVITVDGVTVERGVPNSCNVFCSRNYNGKFDVKNCLIAVPTGSAIIDTRNPKSNTPEFYFDNCVFVTYAGGSVICETAGHAIPEGAHIEFNNIISNAPIYDKSTNNNVIIGENVCAPSIEGTLKEGLVLAKYNTPMDMSAYMTDGCYKILVPYVSEGVAYYDKYVYVFEYGYEFEYGEDEAVILPEDCSNGRYIVLPALTYKTIKAEDAVNVNWVDLAGETTTEAYVNGAPLVAPEFAAVEGNAVKKVFTGFDKELPATVTENVTITAQGEYVQNLKGLLSNLTLYASFEVNLYIPAAYGEFITVSAEGNELETTTVTINDAQYIKVCVARDATAAMSDAIFDIEITEGEAFVEASVTMSVATYATTVLEGEYTEADKSLVKYVINYANEAANYASRPNAELAALAEQYAVEIGEQTYESSADMSALAGIVTDASVILGNAPGFVFYVAEGVTELTVNGKVYVAVDGVVLVTDIRAYDFLNDVTVASGDKTGTYDFAAFAAYHAGSEAAESVAAMSVIEAVYAYVTEAAAYNAAKNA